MVLKTDQTRLQPPQEQEQVVSGRLVLRRRPVQEALQMPEV